MMYSQFRCWKFGAVFLAGHHTEGATGFDQSKNNSQPQYVVLVNFGCQRSRPPTVVVNFAIE